VARASFFHSLAGISTKNGDGRLEEGKARPALVEGLIRMRSIRPAILALATFLAGTSAASADTNFDVDYVVTARGFTVARANFTGAVSAGRYEVNGKLASAGLARIFARTDATTRTSGALSGETAQPESFLLSYVQGGTPSRTEILFKDGAAVKTSIEPPMPAPASDIIPIGDGDLRSVVDPVAATIVARGSPDQVCGRTLRLYEGGTRVDVGLSLAGTGFVYGAGNRAVTCKGSFVPVAGMTRGNKSYEFMRDKSDMEFVYVPAGAGGLYLLHSVSARTEIGRVQVRAWRKKVR
jgi:hypothetical protein